MQKSDLANYFEECTSSKKQLCWPQKSWNDPRSKHCEWISTDDIGLGHPDFEINGNVYPNGIAKGIVNNTLFTEHDGLPRPIYCRDSDAKPWCGQLNGKYATTGKSTFDQWYRDVPRVNKRVGITLDLDLDPQLSADGKDVYVFDSKKFFPLTDFGFKPPLVWPLTVDEKRLGTSNFWFTTELHIYFQYQGGETFSFRGDDDVWVFINGHLEVDIGGLHPAMKGSVNLDNLAHSNLTKGNVYSFDIFHAERHTEQSNFRIETTIAKVCNVVDSGTSAFDLISTDETKLKLLGSASLLAPGGNVILTKGTDRARVGYAWIGQQVNVGTGFVASFTFKMTQHRSVGGDGIAFIIQRHGIDNINGGTGGTMGIDGIKNSIAVVIDTCANRTATFISANSHPCERGKI